MEHVHAPQTDAITQADDPLAQVGAIHLRLEAAGIPVAKVLRRADLAESTWHRWIKVGLRPRPESLARVLKAADELLAAHYAARPETA